MNAPISADQMRALLLDSPMSHDPDPAETAEWRDAFLALANAGSAARATDAGRTGPCSRASSASAGSPSWPRRTSTPSPWKTSRRSPATSRSRKKLASLMRWNALAMVAKANQAYGELGGHIASYASAADLFETGFNHFFHARSEQHRGDLVFFQPHSAPGVYARAFLEGRLSEEDLRTTARNSPRRPSRKAAARGA
jgi:pyruvate dehydrogenase E1 component